MKPMPNTNSELETLIRLKYFPIKICEGFLDPFPEEVRNDFCRIYPREMLTIVIETILESNNKKAVSAVETILFGLCMEFYSRYGWDYDEHGELPDYTQ